MRKFKATMDDKTTKKGTGAASGCRPGTTRHTYVMPTETIRKLKAISGRLGIPNSTLVVKMLNTQIAHYEQTYGPEISCFVKEL